MWRRTGPTETLQKRIELLLVGLGEGMSCRCLSNGPVFQALGGLSDIEDERIHLNEFVRNKPPPGLVTAEEPRLTTVLRSACL